MECAKFPRVRDLVIFHDSKGKSHNALVQCVHGDEVQFNNGFVPCINVIYISDDESRQDTYGRQFERETSLVHACNQAAHGMYWRWPEEKPNPVVAHQS